MAETKKMTKVLAAHVHGHKVVVQGMARRCTQRKTIVRLGHLLLYATLNVERATVGSGVVIEVSAIVGQSRKQLACHFRAQRWRDTL